MRSRYPILSDMRHTTPFESSEEAWLWCCLCEQLGNQRGHGGSSCIARPCESSDIIISIKHLIKQGKLNNNHIAILKKYGFEQAPPHPNFGATQKICALWKEAMGYLDIILRKKGIIYFFLGICLK